MHPLTQIMPSTGYVHVEGKASIDPLMCAAAAAENISTKKAIYSKVYEILLPLPKNKENEIKFIALLNGYAIRTCYAQSTEGFQKCARFLQFSLCRALTLLRLISQPQIPLPPTLEELETHLLQQTNLFKIWNEALDPEVLFRDAHEMSSLIKNALVFLAYSYQNCPLFSISNSNNLQIHSRLNEFTNKFLDVKEAVEFAYTRDPFMITLKNPNAQQERRQCYLDLNEKFKAVLPEHEAEGKEAQVINMFGLTILRENGSVSEAKAHFLKAYAIRSKILQSSLPEQMGNEKHLYANLISNLLFCLCMENNQKEAKPHYEWLRNYILELKAQENQHSFLSSYTKAMAFYEKAFMR